MTFYITLGNDGGIWTGKPNTTTNTSPLYKESSGVTEALYQAACDSVDTSGAFKVVVVGTAGSILLSNRNGNANGTWTKVKQASGGLEGVAYGGGKWVAVGSNNKVLTSADGSNWTETTGAYKGAQWNWITYGNGKFVAVGSADVAGKSIGAVMYSTDGITWTKGNSGTSNHLQSVAYSPTLNVFVAVGNNGSIVSVNG
jgi:hypothetical protein